MRILFSDKAHFWLNSYVNKQNGRIWSEANPQVYVETPLHSEKLTVWCDLWAGGIIGPYFFKNDEGRNFTVNGDRYRALITNFFIPELNNHDVQELCFQQDGATCHTALATIDLLKYTFGDRLISRFGPMNWPSRSCDLTPLDYFLWGYVKSLVYADKPQTLDHLEDNIRRGHKCWIMPIYEPALKKRGYGPEKNITRVFIGRSIESSLCSRPMWHMIQVISGSQQHMRRVPYATSDTILISTQHYCTNVSIFQWLEAEEFEMDLLDKYV
ncbi:putative DD41D transposase [Trichonephila clavipes]|nr:putative DD41D transposase [Trichonephila clavipes]